MAKKDEGARIVRRIRKAERRLARGIDERQERDGIVSERVLLARLLRRQEAMKS